MAELRIAPDLTLPLEAVTEPMGMLAARRAGKSNGAVVIAEEMFRNHLHWVAIDPKGDWWGMRGEGTSPGMPVAILGGEHGDVPLEPGAGAMIADLVVDQRLTCILDVSGFGSEADKIRFLLAFGDRLFRRKKRDQEPTHVFFEEADDYVPQRAFPEQARLVHVMSRILKQGGSRGLGGTVISQRSAVVHKDILSQVQTLFALRTTGPQDRKAIRDWVSFTGENPEIVESLPGLEDGEAWVWSPNFLRRTERFRFRRRSTFDSGATPKIGESRLPPATLADVDLGALTARMADTIERAKAEDPKELHKRIRELERQLGESRSQGERQTPTIQVEHVPVLEQAQLEQLTSLRDDAIRAVTAFHEDLEHVSAQLRRLDPATLPIAGRVAMGQGVSPAPVERPAVRQGSDSPDVAATHGSGVQSPARAAPIQRAPADPDAPVVLTGYGQRLLETLASRHPMRPTRAQLALLSKSSPKSSAFDTAVALIRRLGYADLVDGDFVITDAGWDAAGMVPPSPATAEERLEQWRAALPQGSVVLLDVLVREYPRALSKIELSELSGRSATSSAFDVGISTLRKTGLVELSPEGLRVAADLVGR